MKSIHHLTLAGLALGVLATLSVGCAQDRNLESAFYSRQNTRIYHTKLYEVPVSGVHQYQRGHTARVEGHSPLTSDIFMLNAEQKAAIAHLQQLREERAKAAF